MTRAGREPAEDVKRRLVAACQEVGLTKTKASMHLFAEAGTRIIHVAASFPDWPLKAWIIPRLVPTKTIGGRAFTAVSAL